MGKSKKIFRVKFTETNAYYIDVKAKDEDIATEIAQERYRSSGPLPCAGFETDSAWRGDGFEFTETERSPPRHRSRRHRSSPSAVQRMPLPTHRNIAAAKDGSLQISAHPWAVT
jgi:hypothetical protein